jgi:large subunit ribosomal protein L28
LSFLLQSKIYLFKMSYVCDNCGKKTVIGRSQRHGRGVAGKRWRKRAQSTSRTFKANLQKATVIENGKKAQKKLCTKCIKKIKSKK